jgi:hypothetical protein
MNDKLLHGICGLGIALATGLALYHLVGCTPNFSKGAGLLAAILAGACKETFDAYRAKVFNVKTFDMFDFLATVCGGFLAVFLLITLFRIN